MPYQIVKKYNGWYVAKKDDSTKVFSKKPHKTKKQATAQMRAILANEKPNVKGGFIPFLSTVYNLIPIRHDYSSSIKTLLNQYGNLPIINIIVYRKPIQGFVNTTLNALSLNQWERTAKEQGYDKIMHLYMIASVRKNGKTTPILIEKNDVINVKIASPTDQTRGQGTFMPVHHQIPQGLTINQMLTNAKGELGEDRFWAYNPWNNNCQVFIKYMLSSSHLLDNDLLNFIDQNIESIANQSLISPVQHLAHATTTFSSKLKTLTGRGLLV